MLHDRQSDNQQTIIQGFFYTYMNKALMFGDGQGCWAEVTRWRRPGIGARDRWAILRAFNQRRALLRSVPLQPASTGQDEWSQDISSTRPHPRPGYEAVIVSAGGSSAAPGRPGGARWSQMFWKGLAGQRLVPGAGGSTGEESGLE